MSIAFLTPKGQVIKGSGADSLAPQSATYSIINERFDAEGQLIEFTINDGAVTSLDNTYIYVDKSHYYLPKHRENGPVGYLKKSYFIKLKNDPVKTYYEISVANERNNIWFDNHLAIAAEGDIFHIERVIFDDNLSTYYTYLKQSFKMKFGSSVDYSDYETYPSSINNDLQSPDYNIRDVELKSRLTIEEGNFFEKNFNKIRTSYTLSRGSKRVLYMKMINICFAIYWIRREVLDILAISPINDIETAVKNGTIDQQNGQQYLFLEIDRVIGYLLRDWGFVGVDNARELVPIPEDDYFYEGYHESFTNYSLALDNFYHNLREKDESGLFPSNPPLSSYSYNYPSPYYLGYYNSYSVPLQGEELQKWRSDERIKILKKILPPSALSLLPYNLRLDLIKDFIKGPSTFSQEEEDQCIRIISSFYSVPAEGGQFLEFLLQIGNDNIANFEILEKKFSVGRVMRIAPIVGFFLRTRDYRTNYMYLLYRLWKRSKYNMYYFPDDVNLENNINLQSFFLTAGQGLDYYKDALDTKIGEFTIDYGTVWTGDGVSYSNPEGVKVVKSIVRSYTKPLLKGILINSSIAYNTFYKNSDGEEASPPIVGFPKELTFHLYQPLSIHGLKVDVDLEGNFPEVPYIPAFLWYYSQDYEVMKEMDAALNFVLGVTFDVGLFFITGGTGVIRSFGYLKYITTVGKAFRTGQGGAYVVLILEGLGAGAEVFTLLSSTCTRYYDYMKAKADAGEDTTQYEALHKMFFYLTLLGAGASLTLRSFAINQAKVVKTATYFDTLPSEIIESVNRLVGVEVAQINNFRQDRLAPHQQITSKFDTWSEGKRIAFFNDFKNSSDELLLQINNTDVINNWEKLYAENITDRSLENIIKNNIKTDQIIDYYKAYKVRQTLSSKTTQRRWTFFDDFQGATITQVDEFKNDFQRVNYWEEYRFDPNTANEFNSLNITDKLDIIKEFGGIEQRLFDGFKRSPAKMKEYVGKSTVGRKLLKDNIHFWLKHDLDYNGVQQVKKYLDEAYGTIFKRQKNNTESWITNPQNRPKVIKFLEKGDGWQNGKVFETIAQSYIKQKYLNSNTEVLLGTDIGFFINSGAQINTIVIQELDFLIINNFSNQVEYIGSIKLNRGFSFGKDKNKLCNLWFNLPDTGPELSQYIMGVLKLKGKEFQSVSNAYIIGSDLRSGNPFKELPSQFKNRIKSENEYTNENFIKINTSNLNITTTDIAESAYQSLLKNY
ncbi:hypothetical protein [Chryseobacterium sp. CT-SW4]|uniref:hypothetical protein n=1 Tax=Chryseobacterium sp. SW-1 TaxID=3157343 RepID=UPI003B029D68